MIRTFRKPGIEENSLNQLDKWYLWKECIDFTPTKIAIIKIETITSAGEGVEQVIILTLKTERKGNVKEQ